MAQLPPPIPRLRPVQGLRVMPSILLEDEEPRKEITLGKQTVSFFGHALLALLAWVGLMAVGYVVEPQNIPQWAILAASFIFPLMLGFIVNRFQQSEMASAVWLLGLIWFMIVALWVVDMPTGPNECFQCTLGDKLSRSFLSIPTPSG